MPRRSVHFSQGCSYHIYNRGAGRHKLFIEDDNYLYVLRRTKRYVDELGLTVLAYCLMPNHYHFLIRQDGEIAAGELPKRVFGGYSRAVNKRYGWSGTLFEGRYQAILVDSDQYVISLCRYIHANPVTAGLVAMPGEWPYSNYLEWIRERPGTLWDRAFVETYFPEPAEYIASVRDLLLSKESGDFFGGEVN